MLTNSSWYGFMPAAPTVFLKSFSCVRGVQQATTARLRSFSFTGFLDAVQVVDRADPLALFGEDHVPAGRRRTP